MSNSITGRVLDTRFATLVLACEDMFSANPAVLEPVVDDRISENWNVLGVVTGLDSFLHELRYWITGDREVFYGLVLQAKAVPATLALVIRGTGDTVEWGLDFEGLPKTDTRYPGLVETGFAAIADSFLYRPVGGSAAVSLTAGLRVLAVPPSNHLTVAGHSLGSALATYKAYDAALLMPGRVSLRVWASPHAGNAAFVAAFAALVPDHVHYRNPNDKVPKVPIGFGYCALPNTVDLGPAVEGVEIKDDVGCSHHLLSYIALQDIDSVVRVVRDADRPFMTCIVRKTL